MNPMVMKWVKGIGAIVVLLILFSIVRGWYGDYRSALKSQAAAAAETSATAGSAESTKTADATILVVQTDGLNLRKKASKDADAIRGLAKGEKLTLVKSDGDLYQVKTSKGETGWITSDNSYTKKVTD